MLLSLYKTVIVPWTNNAKVPRLCKEIADSFTPTVPAGKEEEEVVKQLQEFESKESLNLNGKHF